MSICISIVQVKRQMIGITSQKGICESFIFSNVQGGVIFVYYFKKLGGSKLEAYNFALKMCQKMQSIS